MVINYDKIDNSSSLIDPAVSVVLFQRTRKSATKEASAQTGLRLVLAKF